MFATAAKLLPCQTESCRAIGIQAMQEIRRCRSSALVACCWACPAQPTASSRESLHFDKQPAASLAFLGSGRLRVILHQRLRISLIACHRWCGKCVAACSSRRRWAPCSGTRGGMISSRRFAMRRNLSYYDLVRSSRKWWKIQTIKDYHSATWRA